MCGGREGGGGERVGGGGEERGGRGGGGGGGRGGGGGAKGQEVEEEEQNIRSAIAMQCTLLMQTEVPLFPTRFFYIIKRCTRYGTRSFF